MFKKVRTEKVYVRIVKQIRNLIAQGKLKPGDKLLPELILAEKFGTSRPSVREALTALEILGIVESRAGKGNFIKDKVEASIYDQEFKKLKKQMSPFELLEARKVMESGIAEIAAQKASQKDIDIIQESVDKMKGSMTDAREIMKLDAEFHMNVAKATHNSILSSIMTDLTEALRETLWTYMKTKSYRIPERVQKYVKENATVLEAIKNSDCESARRRMYDHLAGVEHDLFNE